MKYQIYLLEKSGVKLPNPNSPDLRNLFKNNCLEYRLDRRTTTYNVDKKDNIKLVLAVSGAGKTRMLLELLYSNFGYYFTCKTSQNDFGSGDLNSCQKYCDSHPYDASKTIRLLYFVRTAVCNYLIEKGFKEPWQILLAQLHPIAFFGIDIFCLLFDSFLNQKVLVDVSIVKSIKPFPLAAIDEIQLCVESKSVYVLPGCSTDRPFFSQLVLDSKMMLTFPHFLLSGTGIDFAYVKELTGSSAMKSDLITDYRVVSGFHALSRSDIEEYTRQFLQEHEMSEVEVDAVVSRLSAFELCHGRPRFIAFILDRYMESNDIDLAISDFVSGLSDVHGEIFPLKFFKRDLDNKIIRVIDDDTFSRMIKDALLKAIWNGEVELNLSVESCATAIRYGLGFGDVTMGFLHGIVIKELAVIECLRYLIPFGGLVKSFTQRISSSPHPQIVGYLMEYFVAFALVCNFAGRQAASSIKAFKGHVYEYPQCDDPSQVCFPDHMCGPDIIYKCVKTKTVYIVQVKFFQKMTKQEAVNACDTTDHKLFYCKRKGNGLLVGFEDAKSKLSESITQLQHSGYELQQMVFIDTAANQTFHPQGAEIITKKSYPKFFDSIGKGVWGFLDSVPSKFDQNIPVKKQRRENRRK